MPNTAMGLLLLKLSILHADCDRDRAVPVTISLSMLQASHTAPVCRLLYL